ncbi:hypothetical protein ACOMHN_019510 [Nucella lapillus]
MCGRWFPSTTTAASRLPLRSEVRLPSDRRLKRAMAPTVTILSLLPILLLLLPAPVYSKANNPPHIVILMADDMGWNDVGYRDRDMHTPNIDNLAREGVIMNSSYMLKSCTPSRSTMLSGTYAFRMGLQDESLSAPCNDSLPLDRRLFPQDFQKKGYSTHYVGKWHLGFCRPEMTPTYRGFDSFYGMYNGKGDHFSHIGKKDGYDIQDNRGHGRKATISQDWSAKGTYSSTLFTNKAVDIIKAHDKDTPLLLFLSYQAVHGPLQVPERYVTDFCANVTGSENRKLHCAMTAAMDEGIGEVRKALKTSGLADNLVTMFLSDNGGPVDLGSSNWPLRGAKTTEWEGGTRVVNILHSTSHLPKAPYTWDGLMHAVDWYPTLLGMAGHDADTSGIDGINNWNSIATNGPSKRTEFVYNLNEVKENYAIRWQQYKLVNMARPKPYGWYNPPAGVSARPEPKGKLPQYMLFNIEKDPMELNDLADKKNHQDVLKQMIGKLEVYKTQIVSPREKQKMTEGYPENRGGAWTTGWC